MLGTTSYKVTTKGFIVEPHSFPYSISFPHLELWGGSAIPWERGPGCVQLTMGWFNVRWKIKKPHKCFRSLCSCIPLITRAVCSLAGSREQLWAAPGPGSAQLLPSLGMEAELGEGALGHWLLLSEQSHCTCSWVQRWFTHWASHFYCCTMWMWKILL